MPEDMLHVTLAGFTTLTMLERHFPPLGGLTRIATLQLLSSSFKPRSPVLRLLSIHHKDEVQEALQLRFILTAQGKVKFHKLRFDSQGI
jgi:hypothetical protein